VRVIAPIPGRGTVGIEVPHKKKEILHLGEILGSDEFLTTDMTLPLAIGKTITGKTFIADLADMPHLLVAGATGQGKSVGLNVMLMSLLHKRTPDELRLVLIDPKKVELKPYEALGKAYLATPIITESAAADRTLSALCGIMDERYEKVGEKGRRNIAEYNASPGVEKMPYYVVVIDEYADLMMTSGREAEMAICRLAQKARAVGIHLIISTQRPSATIVTGNIKANFPTRIAFRCTTGTDSRVVLDQVGAEKLTGNGDMLYFAGAETTRVQCAYVSIEQVENRCKEIATGYEDYEGAKMPLKPEPVKLTHPIKEWMLQWALCFAKDGQATEAFVKGLDQHLQDMFQSFCEIGLCNFVTDKFGKGFYVANTRDKAEIYDLVMTYATAQNQQ
jgi:S-DNA-T family DNA segregation ATPase FtsK/SpoIIIE